MSNILTSVPGHRRCEIRFNTADDLREALLTADTILDEFDIGDGTHRDALRLALFQRLTEKNVQWIPEAMASQETGIIPVGAMPGLRPQ